MASFDFSLVEELFSKKLFDYGGGEGDPGRRNIRNKLSIDCSNLVYLAMLANGIKVDYYQSSCFEDGLVSKHYKKLDSHEDIEKGDVVLFKGHVGIVEYYDSTTRNGRLWNAQRHGMMYEYYTTNNSSKGYAFGGPAQNYLGAFRPWANNSQEIQDEFMRTYGSKYRELLKQKSE